MPVIWKTTKHPGVRYYEHHTRKHGVGKDKYFSIRYQIDGKRKEEGLGWGSEGWTAERAAIERGNLKKAHITGEGAVSLREKREIEKERRAAEARRKKAEKLDQITFAQFFDDTYLPMAKIDKKERTWKTEAGFYKEWLLPVIGNMPFKNITPFHIERIKKNMLDSGRSARTVEHVFAITRQIWNKAVNAGLTSNTTPTKSVKKPKIDNKRERFFTHEEAALLLEKLKVRNMQVYRMTLISLHCGLRMGEVFNLKWGDVSLDKGYMTLRETKSGKTAFAFMTEEVKGMLEAIGQGDPKAYIFINNKGEQMKHMPPIFETVIAECGFNKNITDPKQKAVFHTCRHTFASWLVESGVDLYTVQKLMRHSEFKMTERYAHLGENTLQNAVKQFERNIPKQSIRKVGFK